MSMLPGLGAFLWITLADAPRLPVYGQRDVPLSRGQMVGGPLESGVVRGRAAQRWQKWSWRGASRPATCATFRL